MMLIGLKIIFFSRFFRSNFEVFELVIGVFGISLARKVVMLGDYAW